MGEKALFISDEGEIREWPEFAGKERVTVRFQKPPLSFPIDPKELDEPVGIVEVRWHPVSRLPEAVQKAIVRLHAEREAAQLLALDWFHEWAYGTAIQGFSVAAGELARKSRDLERRVEEEKRRG